MEQEYETGVDDNVMKIIPEETKKLLEEDAIFRLEFDNEAKIVAQAAKDRLRGLIDLSQNVNKNDYDINCQLRRMNRKARNRGQHTYETHCMELHVTCNRRNVSELLDKDLKKEGERIGLSIPLGKYA